jgi:uncharacterized protein (DUF1330 family)
VWFLDLKFLYERAAIDKELQIHHTSMERAREWYRSAEYGEALRLRERALKRRLIFVEGLQA